MTKTVTSFVQRSDNFFEITLDDNSKPSDIFYRVKPKGGILSTDYSYKKEGKQYIFIPKDKTSPLVTDVDNLNKIYYYLESKSQGSEIVIPDISKLEKVPDDWNGIPCEPNHEYLKSHQPELSLQEQMTDLFNVVKKFYDDWFWVIVPSLIGLLILCCFISIYFGRITAPIRNVVKGISKKVSRVKNNVVDKYNDASEKYNQMKDSVVDKYNDANERYNRIKSNVNESYENAKQTYNKIRNRRIVENDDDE